MAEQQDRLEQLKEAQRTVEALQGAGVDMTAQEARRAVNRLITLIRGATPQQLQSFDAWKRERQQAGQP